MADDDFDGSATELGGTLDQLGTRTEQLTAGANGFASAMARAFTQAATGGKRLDDVMKSLVLRLSNMAVSAAFRPLMQGLTGNLNQLFSGLSATGGGGLLNGNADIAAAMGAIKPFASGGVIGTPTYFPLSSGGVGLAGEAGPEAILPLARGPDGRLGVSGGGRGGAITVNISTPDAESFRRSETYITGQIARAVARGQRSL